MASGAEPLPPGQPPSLLEEVVEALACGPAGLVTDIDGTISPIVAVPRDARVLPEARQALATLRHLLSVVAVVSGRGVDDARRMVDVDGIVYVGNHGLEAWTEDGARLLPGAQPWVPRVAAVLEEVRRRLGEPLAEGEAAATSLTGSGIPRQSPAGHQLEDPTGRPQSDAAGRWRPGIDARVSAEHPVDTAGESGERPGGSSAAGTERPGIGAEAGGEGIAGYSPASGEVAGGSSASGILIENKGATASLHYRLAADPPRARRRLLDILAEPVRANGLRIEDGRMVINLLPPLTVTKGSVVSWLVHEHHLSAIVYLGDDTTDAHAFQELNSLREGGRVRTLGIAVVGPETPAGVRELADAVLPSVAAVAGLLADVAERLTTRAERLAGGEPGPSAGQAP